MWRFNDASSGAQRKWQPDAPAARRAGREEIVCRNEEIGFWKVVEKGVGITRRPRYPLKVTQDVVTNTFKRTFLTPFEVWKI